MNLLIIIIYFLKEETYEYASKKKVKILKIHPSKCTGCRGCEMICSAFHASPPFSSINPAKSRIRVLQRPFDDTYLPVLGGQYTAIECVGKPKYVINEKEYEECAFCPVSCPFRNIFKDPDTGLPLTCDMCANDVVIKEPMCVQWCQSGALVYEEKEIKEIEERETSLEELRQC